MTKEEIYNVEEFIKSLPSEIPIKSIRTLRNSDLYLNAPKYFTEIIYEDPQTGKLYPIVKNTLKILRLIKASTRYEEVEP